jgi:maleate cis-trans isomerase
VSDYGAAGLLGVLVPQANTTVEPEVWALMPPGWSMLAARLTSGAGTIAERLVDYTARIDATAAEFANAPVTTLAFACTGASYLVGAQEEARIIDRVCAARGVPLVTAAQASAAALREMGAQRVALLSPYPGDLGAASRASWRDQGFDIVAEAGPALRSDDFHPIYAMAGDAVLESYRALSRSGAEAILMLGTGMATLHALAAGRDEGLTPAISCNLALVRAATGAGDITPWLSGEHWRARLAALFPGDPT